MRVRAALALLILSAALSAPTPAAQIAAGRPTDEPEHSVEVDNERVLIYRIRLDPGDSIPVHTHRRGWVSVTIRGPQPGVGAWHEAGEANPVVAGTYPLEVVEIEVK
jgi:quercetin dioxygenase-like cupin family protein